MYTAHTNTDAIARSLVPHPLAWWQRDIARRLLARQVVPNPIAQLRGRASSYAGHYTSSFSSLLAKLARAGYTVQRIPGPRGGEWSAIYQIITSRNGSDLTPDIFEPCPPTHLH
jgi:hypothetical protein